MFKNHKISNHKIDMRRLRFSPRNLVESLAKLYVNLSAHDDWNRAVCQDERSFSMGMIRETSRILQKSGIPVKK